MARIFDIIEHPNEMKDEFVRRIPEVGSGDFRIGSQLIVREAQKAVFSLQQQTTLLHPFLWILLAPLR